MNLCCKDAQAEVKRLQEQCDKAAMQIDAIRAASMREVSRELARPTPLEPGRISLLAARHLGNYRSEDVVAFVRALELAHNIKEPLQ